MTSFINRLDSYPDIRIGSHCSIANGYKTAVERSLQRGAKAIQMWMGNSKGYACKDIPPAEYKPVRKIVKEGGMFLIAHSPYILNFARPLQESETGIKALERYLKDLVNVTNLGGVGSVLHMGSNVKELKQTMEEAYSQFADNLQWIADRKPRKAVIILENMAGGGTQMCWNIKEWGIFWRNYIPKDLKPHVKWCIDTAHLYAAGEYDLSKRSEVIRFQKEFDREIGWDNVLCFHFNGSKSALGSHRDCHADIGPNMCGVVQTKGLRQIARIAIRTGKPMILETPGDQYNIIEQFMVILDSL